MVDSRYELPLGFSARRANASEMGADRAYDDTKLIRKLWDEWQARPIIDIRNCWQDGESSKLVTGLENVIYEYRGTVSCVCLKNGNQRQMAYGWL